MGRRCEEKRGDILVQKEQSSVKAWIEAVYVAQGTANKSIVAEAQCFAFGRGERCK